MAEEKKKNSSEYGFCETLFPEMWKKCGKECKSGYILDERKLCDKYMARLRELSFIEEVKMKIPELYRDADLSEFTLELKDKSLFLFGPPGTGKTRMCFALLKYYALEKMKYVYINERQLFLSVYGMDYRESQKFIAGVIKEHNCFILDDLFGKDMNEFRVEVYDTLIDAIYSNNYRAIITCNYDLNFLREKIKKVNKLSAEKITSRVYEMCDVVEVNEKNRRQVKGAERNKKKT